MGSSSLILFLVGIILVANAEQVSVKRKIQGINTALIKYDEDLDRVVPFSNIQDAIQGLDVMSQKYYGECSKKISSAYNLGNKATDNYYRARDALYSWATGAKRLFGYVLSHEDTFTEVAVEKSANKTLDNGFKALQNSLELLDTVVGQLSDMQFELSPVSEKLKAELEKFQQEYDEDVKRQREHKEYVIQGLDALTDLAAYALEIAMGPAGKAIDLKKVLSLKHIPESLVERYILPDKTQKIKIVDAYYTALIDTVLKATSNVTRVRDEFKKDFVDELRPWSKDGDNDNSSENKSSGNNQHSQEDSKEAESANLFTELKKLMKTIERITKKFDPTYRRRDFKPTDVNTQQESKQHRKPFTPGHDVNTLIQKMTEEVELKLNATSEERERQYWLLR